MLELVFMFKFIAPIIWPQRNFRLKTLIVLSGFTLVANVVVNFFVPIYAQEIVNSLTNAPSKNDVGLLNDPRQLRWDLVITFTIFKLLQGVGSLSLITLMQQMLWLPIEHHVRHEIQVKCLGHLHSMSLTWMMNTRIGDILGALERGTESIASSVEHLTYSVVPTIVDIIIAITYLAWKFGWEYGVIVGAQIIIYLVFTTYAIEKRSEFQSAINRGEDDLNQRVLESMTNFETVKCFGNEGLEKKKYSRSLRHLQRRQFLIEAVTGGMKLVQLVVINLGLLACSMLLVRSIIMEGRFTPGDYVLCVSFLAQLYGPLNYLGQYYKELRVNLINAKCMLHYFVEEPDIKNAENAFDLNVKEGHVQFKNVSYFGENGAKVLNNVSFTVAPKTIVALVGPSGAGKSTIIRLLFRLLDTTSGEVVVDGSNVKDVTVESLRRAMSIVPQDMSLFNDTIRNNIKYGKLDATNYEVVLAATAASLHDRILSFPDGYDTIVGERGTRLSGGERQRVAIARAILKDPKILVLDEATSSLDSRTEMEIQESLKLLCKNRTCIMITHKLSNAVAADKILVLKDGHIIETGNHSSLLARNGLYASMWRQQDKSNCEVIETESSKGSLMSDKSNRVL